jgi:hypothetical protein
VAGAVFAPLVCAQLDQERARRASIESRAVAVVSTAGALLTIFTGFLALAKGKDYHPAAAVLLVIGVAYLLFVLAAVLGVVANTIGNTLVSFGELPAATLHGWVDEWNSSATADAAKDAATSQISVLGAMRGTNLRKWQLLTVAVSSEIAGAVLFAGIVMIVVAT